MFRAASVILLAAPAAAAAQAGPAAPAPDPAPDIVVRGTPLPLPPGTPAYGAAVIGRTALLDAASGRVEDALLAVAGVQEFRRADSRSANPSAQGLTVRALGGNAASRSLVLLDGVPLADPFFGYIPFTALSPERLGAVRVTRGGGSGAFGAGAVAGTVELASAGRAELPALAGDAAVGSYASERVAASVTPDLGAGYATVSGRWERSDGFPTSPPAQRVAASVPARYRDWSAGLRGVARLDADTEVQAGGLVFDDHRTLRFAGADSRSSGADASVRLLRRGAGWQVDALAYLQARDFANQVVSATSYRVTLDQRATPSLGGGGKLELRPPLGGGHVARVGADLRLAGGEADEDAYTAAGALSVRRAVGGSGGDAGLFAADDWTLGGVVLTGAARLDRWWQRGGFLHEATPAGATLTDAAYPDRGALAATGRAGALWHAGATLELRAAGYTGLRVPTLNELYRSYVVFPVTVQANPALAPERLVGAEAGLDWRPFAGASLAATLFRDRLGDAVANVTVGPNLRQRRNVPAITSTGLEMAADWRGGAWRLGASLAWTAAAVRAPGTALDGLRPAQSPRFSASATAGWTRGRLRLDATLRRVGRQYEDDLMTAPLPPATTLDAVASVALRRGLALVLRGENLGDAAVVTRDSGGTVDLGTPRVLWVGVRIGR